MTTMRNICEHSKPEDFIGYETDEFKVIGIDAGRDTVTLELKNPVKVVTVNVHVGLGIMAEKGII